MAGKNSGATLMTHHSRPNSTPFIHELFDSSPARESLSYYAFCAKSRNIAHVVVENNNIIQLTLTAARAPSS
jgi:hypothetical protein